MRLGKQKGRVFDDLIDILFDHQILNDFSLHIRNTHTGFF